MSSKLFRVFTNKLCLLLFWGQRQTPRRYMFSAMPLNTKHYSTMLKFWRAPIGRSRSPDAIVFLLSGRLSAHSARLWQFSLKI